MGKREKGLEDRAVPLSLEPTGPNVFIPFPEERKTGHQFILQPNLRLWLLLRTCAGAS